MTISQTVVTDRIDLRKFSNDTQRCAVSLRQLVVAVISRYSNQLVYFDK